MQETLRVDEIRVQKLMNLAYKAPDINDVLMDLISAAAIIHQKHLDNHHFSLPESREQFLKDCAAVWDHIDWHAE